MTHDTILDRILSGDIPADTVYEDEHVLAFRDIQPQAPTHVLVIPKHRVERFAEIADEDDEWIGRFFSRVSKIASRLGLDEDGYRVVINNGKNGQQSVEYLHAHILGGRALNWPPG